MPPDCHVFPTEVFETVIDQASDRPRSLWAISLTCRDFLPRARYHLFYHIRISSKEQMFSIPVFLHERPWLLPLVRYITIAPESPEDGLLPGRLFEVIPVPLFTQLPNLRGLRLTNYYSEGEGVSLSRIALSALRIYSAPVRHVELFGVAFSSVHDLMRHLSGFSNLSRLTCRHVRLKKDEVPPRADVLSHYNLELTHLNVDVSPPTYLTSPTTIADAKSCGLVIDRWVSPSFGGYIDICQSYLA